ncbi:MAG: cupin domain-containing protein [Thalassobaculum sp.]|uniref:cupin domain-containing protein n=1 Tax=Thalassobaculum sp. TaxID=2022740 RepID=UPI0032EA960D
MSAGEVRRLVETLGLQPHPEGGWYGETFRDRPAGGGRGALTQIFYLLGAGEISAWHRVTDATEVWHHYAGGPLLLSLSADGRETAEHVMGPDVLAGQTPHVVVPPGVWQSARPLGDWALCGCTVAPAFEFAGFEMAPPGWEPGS